MTEETTWSNGVTVLGKIAKPGSKVIVHANGRQSLNFTVIIPSGIPFEGKFDHRGDKSPIYWRCRWFDPDYFLNTSDIVRVSGLMNKNGQYPGLLVNNITVLARWITKREARLSGFEQEAGQHPRTETHLK